jgi:hypothetical protein
LRLGSRAKRFLTAALLAALCLCGAAAHARQARVDVAAVPFSQAPYAVGEHLTYTVAFSNFPTAAHVQLEVATRGPLYGREGVELRAHAETIGVVSAALYALNNSYATFVDPANGLPYRVWQSIREGSRVQDVTLDYNTPAASFFEVRAVSAAVAGTAYDLLSALYRLRAMPLAPGFTYTLPVRNGETFYNAEIKVVGHETIKTNVGSTNALVAQVRVRDNRDADDYRPRIYFTDDERHVPVLITARHRAGEIRVELASAEMLTTPAAPLAGATPAPTPQTTIPLPPGTMQGNARPGTNPPANTATNPPAAAAAAPAELPFKPGEQLNFNFFLSTSTQPVGTASFLVRARQKYFNRDGLLLTAALQTTGTGQALFPVSDQISSYVDAASVLPFRTELTLQEGKRRARFVVSPDPATGAALFEDGTRVEMPVGTHDLLSVFYALRSFDLSPGKRTTVSLLINKRPRLLFITALRPGAVQLGGQTIEAVELSLTTSDPNPDRFALRLWVSTDRRRLPLRLTAQTPLGPVRADLAIIPTTLQ